MTDLKQCPFCGGADLLRGGFNIRCMSCGADGPIRGSMEAGTGGWNTRHDPMRAKLRELVKRWTTLVNEMDTFALDDAAEAAGISKCIDDLEALLEVE